jgi:hypothetical protein
MFQSGTVLKWYNKSRDMSRGNINSNINEHTKRLIREAI